MNFLRNLPSASFRAGHAVAPVKERKGGMEEGITRRKKKEGRREGKKGSVEFFCHSRQKFERFFEKLFT